MHDRTTHLQPPIPGGTRVLNTNDGEIGSILNGYVHDGREWTEYEVETRNAIEIWKRSDFLESAEFDE